MKMLFLSLAMVSVTISLAAPKIQYEKTVFNRSGINLAIGIDVSKSMLAEDVFLNEQTCGVLKTPQVLVMNRLNHARFFALNLLAKLRGEQAGVFIFARKGIEVVPLTGDYGYCRYILRHINDTEITLPGSDLGEAVRTGITMLSDPERLRKSADMMILISDGEDISPDVSSLYEACQNAARHGIKIYTAGVGTAKETLIPVRDAAGESVTGYYLNEDGIYLKTRLTPETLKQAANMSGGKYFHVNDKDMLKNLMKTILQDAGKLEETKRIEPVWFDLSPVFLGIGLGCWLFAKKSIASVDISK